MNQNIIDKMKDLIRLGELDTATRCLQYIEAKNIITSNEAIVILNKISDECKIIGERIDANQKDSTDTET